MRGKFLGGEVKMEFDSFRNPSMESRESFVIETYEDEEGLFFMDRVEKLVPVYREPYEHPDVEKSKVITEYNLYQENKAFAAISTYVLSFTPISKHTASVRIVYPEQVELTTGFWCRV